MRIEWLDEDLAFLVTLPEWADRVNFGGPATHGATYEEAVKNGREVLELLVASARACGDVLPSPRVYVPASQLKIDRLREAFDQAQQRSTDEQEAIADLLLEELRASARWDILFADPRSDMLLDQLVNEALAEDEAGEPEEITGDKFL